MRLSTVHLKDYKSYRGSVTVGPFSSNLSTIVGPNGAGKSTVIDGILFALGASATEGSSIAINHACGSDECSVAVVLVGDASPTRLTVQRRCTRQPRPVVRGASVRASPQPAPLYSTRVNRGGRSKYAVKECHCGRDEQGAHAAATPRLHPTPPRPRLHAHASKPRLHAHASTPTPRSHASKPRLSPGTAECECAMQSLGRPAVRDLLQRLVGIDVDSPERFVLKQQSAVRRASPCPRPAATPAPCTSPALCTSPSPCTSPSGARRREDAAAAAPLPRAHARHRAAARRRRGGAQGQG